MFYILSKCSFPKAVIPILHSFLSLCVSTACVQGSEGNFGNQSSPSILFETRSPLLFTVHTQASWLKSSGKFSRSMCHRAVRSQMWATTSDFTHAPGIWTQVPTIVQQAPSPLSHLLSSPSVFFLVTKSLQFSRSLTAFDAWLSHFCHPNIRGITLWLKYFFRQFAQEGYGFPMPRTVITWWSHAAGRMVVMEIHGPAEKPLTPGVLSQIQSPLDF